MKWFIPPVLVAICLTAMLLLAHAWPIAKFLHAPWNYLGLLCLLPGLFLCAAAVLQLLRKRTTLEPFGEPATLVTRGVFRYSRNPIYLGYALALLGVWLLTGALSASLPVLVYPVVTDRLYIAFEEKMLARQFGAAYDEYRRNTRRWL
jgi:protein-S-isoprenylcysteine O-methyltransferase Ste14